MTHCAGDEDDLRAVLAGTNSGDESSGRSLAQAASHIAASIAAEAAEVQLASTAAAAVTAENELASKTLGSQVRDLASGATVW